MPTTTVYRYRVLDGAHVVEKTDLSLSDLRVDVPFPWLFALANDLQGVVDLGVPRHDGKDWKLVFVADFGKVPGKVGEVLQQARLIFLPRPYPFRIDPLLIEPERPITLKVLQGYLRSKLP